MRGARCVVQGAWCEMQRRTGSGLGLRVGRCCLRLAAAYGADWLVGWLQLPGRRGCDADAMRMMRITMEIGDAGLSGRQGQSIPSYVHVCMNVPTVGGWIYHEIES